MIITGTLVCIRAIEYADLPFLRRLMNDASIEAQTIDTHFPVSEKAQRAWYEQLDEQKELRCIIENREHQCPVGYLSITEIDHRNQNAVVAIEMDTASHCRTAGDMDEVFSLMTAFCFNELNLQRLQAEVLADNLLSIKNLLKHGFEREGILRRKCYKHGKWNDIEIYSLLRN